MRIFTSKIFIGMVLCLCSSAIFTIVYYDEPTHEPVASAIYGQCVGRFTNALEAMRPDDRKYLDVEEQEALKVFCQCTLPSPESPKRYRDLFESIGAMFKFASLMRDPKATVEDVPPALASCIAEMELVLGIDRWDQEENKLTDTE